MEWVKRAMGTHLGQQELQLAGLQVVCWIASLDGKCTEINATSGVAKDVTVTMRASLLRGDCGLAVLDAMAAHPDDARVQAGGCEALRRLFDQPTRPWWSQSDKEALPLAIQRAVALRGLFGALVRAVRLEPLRREAKAECATHEAAFQVISSICAKGASPQADVVREWRLAAVEAGEPRGEQ